ncbi:hypothetical protein [Celerinatantimonas sp. YJH-8]|uniref:hypothetical protein n=1 Tax=Celerinatantimonas sp. YJH-8 TaxID=3228714 RepID=UPI0038CC0156
MMTLCLAFGVIGCQSQMPEENQRHRAPAIPTSQANMQTPFDLNELIKQARSSQCVAIPVPGRGDYPKGWFNGMILAFARSSCRGITAANGDIIYSSMVGAVTADETLGRLTPNNINQQTYTKSYNKELAPYSAANQPSGQNLLYLPVYQGLALNTENKRLEVLYSLLLTLGMRESSGGIDNGIDPNAAYYSRCMRKTPGQCEAGSLQASQDSSISLKMQKLYSALASQYWMALSKNYQSACHWNTFNEGISNRVEDPIMQSETLRKFNNKYSDFRNLMIGCPMANVEYNAMLLRQTYAHHGPIKRFEAPLNGACIDMFADIHALIEKHAAAICDAVQIPSP